MNVGEKYIGLRVPPALNDRLEAQARRENNHLSSVARRLLTEALDRADAERAPAARPKAQR